MKMTIFPMLLIPSFLFISCSEKVGISCCELTNVYKMYDCKNCSISKPIDVAKGYEQMAKSIFIDEKVSRFSSKVDRYLNDLYYTRKVNYPYISTYCREAEQISSKDLNATSRIAALDTLKDKWIRGYKKQLTEDIKGKLKFNKLDGCDTQADALESLVQDKSGTHKKSEEHYSNVKLSYQECLYLVKQKKEQAEINKLKKNIGGINNE